MLDTAKQELIKDGSIMPKAFIIKDAEIIVIMMEYADDDEKDMIRKKLKKFVLDSGSKEYYMVQEMWVSRQKDDMLHVVPRRDINKREAIAVIRHAPEKSDMLILEFKRDKDDKIIFSDKEQVAEQQSSYWNAWGDDGKKMRNMIQAHDAKVINKLKKQMDDKFKEEFLACKTVEERMKVMIKIIEEVKRMKSDQEKNMLEDVKYENPRERNG